MREKPQYFLYGKTPVKFEPTPSGGLRVQVFDRKTKKFVSDSTYRSRVLYDRDNLTVMVDQAEFERQVVGLGGRRIQRDVSPTQKVWSYQAKAGRSIKLFR
ncbi:hypothetical protein [Deinococcus alpinitundrae]|uniref:hypothetical protein n=1 Tax=Deinococcus alpinitundrae TaxID=468913 RepID=UPI00137A9223|nr:hypothetical protein [Deinococcus alpinitundrae]